MAQFPNTVYSPRETENLPGIVYDPTNKQNMYSEDFQNLGAEIEAIETQLLALGWRVLPACTYEGADSPVFTVSFASNMTSKLSPGMKIKLTDSTVKYFIIVKVGTYSGGKTIITLYGGTDYTLSGGSISSPYFSIEKSPVGFPLNPDKWSVIVSSYDNLEQATPTQQVWYNLGSLSINVPIGVWNVRYDVDLRIVALVENKSLYSTFSTQNNAEDDRQYTSGFNSGAPIDICFANCEFVLNLSSKTTYYLLAQTGATDVTTIHFRGNYRATVIKCVCAYL